MGSWAKNVFKSTRKTGDYHGQMNADQFQKWFSKMLLPNIPPNSIIIMDNASYHKALTEDSAPILQVPKKRYGAGSKKMIYHVGMIV